MGARAAAVIPDHLRKVQYMYIKRYGLYIPCQIINNWLRWFNKLVVDDDAGMIIYDGYSCEFLAVFGQALQYHTLLILTAKDS